MNKKNSKNKIKVPLDKYGAREDATDEEKIKAIVNHFQSKWHRGEMEIRPGAPKPRDINRIIAQNTDKQLLASVEAHIDHLDE